MTAPAPTQRGLKRSVCGALLVVACALPSVLVPVDATAVPQCGNQKDTCKCGKANPYPCCGNGSNCTWWAWGAACCNWKQGLPGWGNANTWASYAKQNPNFKILGSPVVGSIATSTKGKYGHVAWVVSVGNGTVRVTEMNCCGTCNYGMRSYTHQTSYFNSGFIVPQSYQTGPQCGNNKCESGENCANCSKDCGACCGNGKCDNGETCSTCSKDCGACCGNGKCDHGETCSTCNKDCHCAPSGALETTTCSAASGWAQDSDAAAAKVTVRLSVDGKKVADIKAGGAHPKHAGHGFKHPLDATWHDSKPHTVSATALDTQKKTDAEIGKRPLLCQNHASDDGIWHTTRAVFAGADVQRPDASPPRLAIAHAHPKGYKYALSGVIKTCTDPGLQAFERMAGTVSWQLGGGELRGELLLDDALVGKWDSGAGDEPLAHDVEAKRLCLRTTATDEAIVAAAREVRLFGLRFLREGWWYSYSADVSGLIAGIDDRTGLQVRARPSVGGAKISGQGLVRFWRALPALFDEVVVKVTGAAGGDSGGSNADAGLVVEVVGGGDAHATDGARALPDGGGMVAVKRSDQLGLQVRVQGERPLDAGLDITLSDIRVRQRDQRLDPPWSIEKVAAWGLGAAVADGMDPAENGRHIRLSQVPMGWWATGAVHAKLTPIEGPFERISGRFEQALSDPGPEPTIAVDGKVIVDHNGGRAFDVAAVGATLSASLRYTQDTPPDELVQGHVDVRGLGFCRAGWWTRHSPQAKGLRTRQRTDGIGVEAAGGADISGHVRLERQFTLDAHAVRFHYRQGLDPNALRVLVLLDDVPMALLSEHGVTERDVVVAGATFNKVGFVLSVTGDAPIGDHQVARFSGIELRDAAGVWRPIESVPDAPAIALERDAEGLDVVGGGAGTDGGAATAAGGGDAGGGCSATHGAPVSGQHVWWALFACALVLGVRRRVSIAKASSLSDLRRPIESRAYHRR